MPIYRSLDFKSLSSRDRKQLEHFLEPLSIPLSAFQPSGTEIYHGEAAFENDHMIGLLVSELYRAAQEVRFPLYHIQSDFEPIGLQLMENMLHHLRTTPAKFLEFVYKTWEVDAEAFEKIFAKTGWDPPKTLTSRYYFDQHSFFPKWFFAPRPLLPSSLKMVSWEDLSHHDLETIKAKVESSSMLSPFDENVCLELMNSLALRYENEIIGWIAVHRLSPKLIRYSSFYIDSEFRQLGLSINLLKESIRRHLIKEIETVGLAEINERYSSFLWKTFVRKRLAPYAFQTEIVKSSFMIL